MLGRFRKS